MRNSASELPSETEPLILADGTKIDPTTGKVIKDVAQFIEIPSNTEARQIVSKVRRNVAELPEVPKRMNTIGIIVAYTLFGLSDNDIAIALEISIEQVKNIKALDAFDEMMNGIVNGIIDAEGEDLRDLIKQNARTALGKVVELMHSESDAIALNASKDVLDRAGHRPADVVEHRHQVEGGLQIEYIKRDESQRVPLLDVTPIGDEEDGNS